MVYNIEHSPIKYVPASALVGMSEKSVSYCFKRFGNEQHIVVCLNVKCRVALAEESIFIYIIYKPSLLGICIYVYTYADCFPMLPKFSVLFCNYVAQIDDGWDVFLNAATLCVRERNILVLRRGRVHEQAARDSFEQGRMMQY